MARINLDVRKKIVHNYCTEKNISYRKLAKRYNISPNSVKNIIIKFGNTCNVENLPKCGRKKGPANLKLEAKILALMNKNKSMSVRDLAKRASTSVGMIQRVKHRHNLKTYKKQKQPKKSEKQVQTGKTRLRKLYDRFNRENVECIVMDDETYVKMDSRTLPGPQFYTKEKGSTVDQSVSTVEIEKFGEKVLIWQAICSCGLKTTPFFTKGTINADIYQNECLKRRLIPFYKKHMVSTIFWPDLASAHYARSTLSLLEENDIKYVDKEENPPNAPEFRPIERFWALVKRNMKKDGRVSNDMKEFKKNWQKANKAVTKEGVQNLMKGVKQKIRRKLRE